MSRTPVPDSAIRNASPTQNSPDSGAYLIRLLAARAEMIDLANIQRQTQRPLLARPEDIQEDRIPLLLIVRREHGRQHLLLVQHLHHARRIGVDVEPR